MLLRFVLVVERSSFLDGHCLAVDDVLLGIQPELCSICVVASSLVGRKLGVATVVL